MPYPGEHAARIKDPKNFPKFRRQNNKFGPGIHVIFGITDDGKAEVQAIRFDKDKFTVEEAKKWLKDHDYKPISFEPAAEEKSMNQDIERRNLDITEFRIVMEEGKKPRMVGHAAMFDKLSLDLGGFMEKIAPGTFKNTIQKDDIRALFNHDPNFVLGRNLAKTLRMEEDAKGLRFEIDLPETSYAKDLMVSVDRGDISGMSFGFRTIKDSWQHTAGKPSIRTLEEVRLLDISPVTYPAYPQTSVQVRDYLTAIKEAEGKPDNPGPSPEEVTVGGLDTLKAKIQIAELS